MEKSNNEQQNIMDKSMRSVFVGNIPYEATEEKLKDIFSEVGPVLSLKLVFDRETGKPKGYGFCEYKDQETALSAMRNLNGYEIGGRTLRVDNACTEKSRMEMQQLLQGPQVENPYGDPVPPDKAPEVISKVVSSLPPERLHIIVNEMRACIQQNPNEARTLLLRNPQLAYALLQAQVVMKFVDPKDALTFLYKPNEMPPVLLNHDIPDRPLGIGGVPIPVPLPPLNPNTIFSAGQDIDLRSVNGRSIDPRLHRGSEMPPVGPPNIGGIRGPPAPINSFPPRANATDPRLRPTLEPKSQPPIRPNNIAPDIVKPPPPMKGVHPLPPQPGNVSPGLYSGVLAVDASDQEKAALIMQVLQLSDEQIAMLPPEQRTSILILKEQIAKSTKR